MNLRNLFTGIFFVVNVFVWVAGLVLLAGFKPFLVQVGIGVWVYYLILSLMGASALCSLILFVLLLRDVRKNKPVKEVVKEEIKIEEKINVNPYAPKKAYENVYARNGESPVLVDEKKIIVPDSIVKAEPIILKQPVKVEEYQKVIIPDNQNDYVPEPVVDNYYSEEQSELQDGVYDEGGYYDENADFKGYDDGVDENGEEGL